MRTGHCFISQVDLAFMPTFMHTYVRSQPVEAKQLLIFNWRDCSRVQALPETYLLPVAFLLCSCRQATCGPMSQLTARQHT